MNDLWNNSFSPDSNVNMPDEIIKAQCEYLEQRTSGIIVAKVADYDGPIHSYDTSIGNALYNPYENEYDVQKDLGNIPESRFTFEFFITSTSTPNYKYRIMFLSYAIPFYPVDIVLDEAIAMELNINDNYIYCNTQKDFELLLKNILNSKKIVSIINSLLTIAKKEGRLVG